jgi:hypothetical protein
LFPDGKAAAANRTISRATDRNDASMPLRRMSLIAAFLLASALSATAQKTAIPVAADTQDNPVPQKRDVLGCEGAFAKDTSQAKLVTAFGAKNVTFKEVDAAEGSKEKATVLFDDDPTRRIVVFWHDEKNRARPNMIRVSAPSLWVGPGGIGNGMKLTDVEKLNGKPFKLAGFDWDGGGFVREITGDKTIISSNKLLRRTRAQVSEWGIGYPR